MTDIQPTQGAANDDPAPSAQAPVIVVNGNPGQDQLEAGIRQFLSVVGLLLPLIGLAKYTGVLGFLVANSMTVAAVISAAIGLTAIIWGQWKTRVVSIKGAAMANKLPDTVARTK
jgi:hypothetical protein